MESELQQKYSNYNELQSILASRTNEVENLESLNNKQQATIRDLEAQISKLKKTIESSENTTVAEQMDTFKIIDANEMQQLRIDTELGYGSTGITYKVVKTQEQIYVMKKMKKIDQKTGKKFVKEYELLNSLHHPNILKTYGIFIDDKSPLSILLEFCEQDMTDAIKNKDFSTINILCWIFQIAEGMKYVHSKNIIHLDLKPGNILVTKDGNVKICDFGIAKLFSPEEMTSISGELGTAFYMAPEVLNHEKINEKVDVYSFGVLMFFVLNNGQVPGLKILQGKKLDFPPKFTNFAKNLIEACLSQIPDERPSFSNICSQLKENNFELVSIDESEKLLLQSSIAEYQKTIEIFED